MIKERASVNRIIKLPAETVEIAYVLRTIIFIRIMYTVVAPASYIVIGLVMLFNAVCILVTGFAPACSTVGVRSLTCCWHVDSHIIAPASAAVHVVSDHRFRPGLSIILPTETVKVTNMLRTIGSISVMCRAAPAFFIGIGFVVFFNIRSIRVSGVAPATVSFSVRCGSVVSCR